MDPYFSIIAGAEAEAGDRPIYIWVTKDGAWMEPIPHSRRTEAGAGAVGKSSTTPINDVNLTHPDVDLYK